MITKKLPSRQPVLIVSHPDGHVEIFSDRHVDVYVARVPVASSREAEVMAEDVIEMLIPRRYRGLYRADRLRKNGTTRPLLPSVLADSIRARKDIDAINELRVNTPAEEVLTWAL